MHRIKGYSHSDVSKLYGILSVSAFDIISGKRVYHSVKKNQVTNTGRIIVLDLLSQIAPTTPVTAQMYPAYNQIWSLGIGDSTIPADATQTSLYSPRHNQKFDITSERVKVEEAFEVRIIAEVEAGTATNVELAEAGLFTRGSQDEPDAPGGTYTTWESIPFRRMYARQTHPAFIKALTMRVVYEWTLGMTVSA